MAVIMPYSSGDWELIEPREIERKGMETFPHDVGAYAEQGPALTIWDNSRPVMCGGIHIRPDGEEGEIWLFCSKWVETHPMVARLVRDFMWSIVKDYRLKYLRAIVNISYPKNVRFLEWLGFRFEKDVPELSEYKVFRRMV